MEEKNFQSILTFIFKKSKYNPDAKNKKICAVYGEGSVNDWNVFWWLVLEISY